jgi:3-deoxy-D-manno-octulosonic-acid transferase
MYVGYTILLMLGGLVLLPRVLWRGRHGAAYHRHWLERFGYGASIRSMLETARGCLWFHAASVGEVQGLQPILSALHDRFPDLPLILSTFTPTGRALARRVVPEAQAVFLLPFDFPWIVRRFVRRLRPRALIVQETEIWPHLFRAAAHQDVPVVMVNGRLSPRAYRRYMWIRSLMQRVLADVTLLLVQSETTGHRFRHLGAPVQRLHVVGNTNIDRALLTAAQPLPPHPLAPLMQTKRLWVGGSTHEGEETVLLAVYRQLYEQHPDLLLVLAPRHPERADTVFRQIQAYQCRALRRSQFDVCGSEALSGPTAVILDTLGELPSLYRLCSVAFVGGSLVPIGGHNILEPAVFAKPLFFGPHMHHFPELAAMLRDTGGAVQVQGEADLYAHMAHVLSQPQAGQAMGKQALRILMANRGALQRTTQAVADLLQRYPHSHTARS